MIEFLVYTFAAAVSLAVLYLLIRTAVKHGMLDAYRQIKESEEEGGKE